MGKSAYSHSLYYVAIVAIEPELHRLAFAANRHKVAEEAFPLHILVEELALHKVAVLEEPHKVAELEVLHKVVGPVVTHKLERIVVVASFALVQHQSCLADSQAVEGSLVAGGSLVVEDNHQAVALVDFDN